VITIHSEYHFILFQPVKSQLDSKIICGKNPRAEIGWPVLSSVMIHLGTVVRLPVICIVVFASPSPEQVGISVHFLKLIFTERSDTTKIFLVWKSNGNKSQDIKS
jgi:hypothetical protein